MRCSRSIRARSCAVTLVRCRLLLKLPPVQQSASPQSVPEETPVPQQETAETGNQALPDEMEIAADATEPSVQEAEPQPVGDPESDAPAQIIQSPEPDPEPSPQVIWSFLPCSR